MKVDSQQVAEALDDNRLSFTAKGILVYMFGKPGIDLSELYAQKGTSSEEEISQALTELAQYGYFTEDRS